VVLDRDVHLGDLAVGALDLADRHLRLATAGWWLLLVTARQQPGSSRARGPRAGAEQLAPWLDSPYRGCSATMPGWAFRRHGCTNAVALVALSAGAVVRYRVEPIVEVLHPGGAAETPQHVQSWALQFVGRPVMGPSGMGWPGSWMQTMESG
jgi:hypothetical protein